MITKGFQQAVNKNPQLVFWVILTCVGAVWPIANIFTQHVSKRVELETSHSIGIEQVGEVAKAAAILSQDNRERLIRVETTTENIEKIVNRMEAKFDKYTKNGHDIP